MANDPDGCSKKMWSLLPLLADMNCVPGGLPACKEVLQQYKNFLSTTVKQEYSRFSAFNKVTDHCGTLCYDLLSNASFYSLLWRSVVQDMLILSHGQAAVEHGFSLNKELEGQNLTEQSFVAKRIICDHVSAVGGISNVEGDKHLLVSASLARQQYMVHLEEGTGD